MSNLKFKLKQLLERHDRAKLKHLRGRHDQLDHAWNRGMGGGGGGADGTISVQQYRSMIQKLDEQVAAGDISQKIADLTRQNLRAKTNQRYDAITSASLGMARIPRRRRASTQISNIRQGLLSDDLVFDGFPQPQPLNLNLNPITTVPVTSAPVSPVITGNNILAPFTNNLQLNIPGRIVNPYAALAAIHDATYDTQAADYARFKPQRTRVTKTLSRLPFIKRQISEAQDSAQADRDGAETASKIVKSMSFRRSGNIGFLTGEINQLIKQYDSLANGMFKNSNFVKNQLVALQQRITAKKAELYAEQNALAAETRDNFKADTPSVIATPTITNLNSEQQAQVRSALNKISVMMDASQMRTSHGGPLQFEVKGEHLGPNGPLALHRANIVRDSVTNEIDWTQSGSEIIINLDAVDQATIESSVVHEFGHVLQTQAANDFINDHADYIYNRLAGEPLRFADDGTAFYEDLFTRTYSGAIGNNNSLRPLAGMPFEAVNQIARANGLGTAFPMEALSTGLEQYIMDPHGLMINDPDLFMHMHSLLTGKSAAQRTAKRIADDAAAAAGATPATPTVPPGGGTTPVLPGGGTATVKHPAFDGTTNVNGISYTKADLSHPFTAPMVDVTDASGTVIGQRRAVPYIDEVDPASLHTDLSGNPALVNRLGNLQRAVDAEYAAAMKSTGEQRAIHMMRAARISARIFQKYPDIRALENALAFASDMEVSNLPAGHPLESMVNDINNYGSFWLYPFSTDPKGNKTADPIPNEIYQYGVPGFDLIDQFDIYESIPFINIPSFSGVQLYRDQDSINQTSFISDAEISATPLTGTPPASTSITTPLNPGMITPPVTPGTPITPGTPVTPATTPLNPGMITPTTTPKTTPLSTINSTEMIDRYVGDAQATEFLVSPQFYPTGFGSNVGQYETMSYKRNSGAKATNVKGRRKAPYIDEVAFDALPDSLQNDPVTVAKLSLLQRRYDAALANAWAFARGSGDPAWRLEAARIAAEMFNLYPDARVLADAQKIMPKVNDFNVGDTESRELAKTVADYVNYWSSPTRYIPPAPDFGGYTKPASRVELPMPDSIKKFGMPGQNLSPRIQIYDHLTKSPDTQFKYGQGLPAGATSVLKDMADGKILPQTDSFVQDSEYDTTDVIKALPVQAAARSAGNAAKAIPDVSDSVKNILSTRPPVVAPATPSTTPATTPLTDTEATPTPKRTRKPKPADLVDKILPPEPMGTDEEMLTEGELLQGNTFSDKAPGVAGNEAIAYAPDPKNIYRVRHRIVDLGDIKASNLLSGSVNPDYDPVLQPRDRERIASLAQTNALAKDLRPVILIRDQQQTATGSPIINADGMVLSGNGRVMALQLIQDDSLYPGRATAYREEVLKRAESLGIDPAEIEGMKFPVVVRELAEDVDSVTFARDANAPSSARMSPIEEARIDARTVTPELIALIDPGDGENIDEALQSAAGRAFTRAFLALLPANERPAYLTKDGSLNSNGLIRAKAAVFAATFNSAVGDELTTALLDGTGDMKKIETGLAGALPALAKIAAEARKGNINPDMDPTNDLATAIVALGRILRMPGLQAFGRKQKVAAWLNQGDFTIPEGTEKLTPAARSLLEYIDTIATSPRKLRQFFNDLAQNIEAQKDGTGQSSLLDDLGIAPMDLNDVVIATIAAQAPEPSPTKPSPSSSDNRAFPIPTDPLANTNRILTDSSSPETNTPAAVVVGNNGKEYPDSEVYRASDAFIKSGSKYDSELNFVDFDKLIAEAATPEQAEMVQDAKEQFLKMAQKIKEIDGYGFESRPVTTASAIKNIEKYSELVEEMIDALDEELSPEMLETIARHVSDVIEKYGKIYNKEWSAGKKENNKRPSRQHALDENLSNATSGAYRYWYDQSKQYKRLANPTESEQSGPAINSAATINPKSPTETIIRTPKASFDAFDDESKEEINQLTQQWLNASTQEQNIDILKRLAQIYTSQALNKNITPTERYRLYSDMIQFDDAQIDAIAKSDLSETEKRKQTNRVQNNRDNKLGIQDVILESNPEASVLPTDSNETPVVAPSSTPDATSTTSDATSEDANNAFSDNPPTPVGQRLPLRSIIPNPQYSFDNFSDAAKQEISELTQQLASSQTQEQNIRILDRLEMIYSQRLFDNVSPAEKNALYNDLIQITDVMPNAVAASNMPETVKRRWLVMINKRRNEYREIQSNLVQQPRLI